MTAGVVIMLCREVRAAAQAGSQYDQVTQMRRLICGRSRTTRKIQVPQAVQTPVAGPGRGSRSGREASLREPDGPDEAKPPRVPPSFVTKYMEN